MNKVLAGVFLVALVGGVWLIKDYLVSETPLADQVAVEDDSSTAAGHPSESALDDASGERAERSQRDGVVEPRIDADALEAILSRALVFCEPRFRQAVEGRTAQEVAHQRRLVALLNSPDLGTNSRAVRALQGMPLTTDMAEKIAAYADEQNQVQASQAAVVLAIDPTGSGQPELAKLLLAEYSELLENPYVTQRHKVSAILGAVGELMDAAGELAESEPFLGALRKIAEDFEREPEISRNGVDENEQLRSVAGQALTILCRSGTLPFDQIITELTGADGPIRTRVLGALVERGHGFSADERKALVAALPRDLFVSTSSSENELLLAATCGDPRVPDFVERQFADAEPASMHYLMRLQAGYCRAGASDAVTSLTKYAAMHPESIPAEALVVLVLSEEPAASQMMATFLAQMPSPEIEVALKSTPPESWSGFELELASVLSRDDGLADFSDSSTRHSLLEDHSLREAAIRLLMKCSETGRQLVLQEAQSPGRTGSLARILFALRTLEGGDLRAFKTLQRSLGRVHGEVLDALAEWLAVQELSVLTELAGMVASDASSFGPEGRLVLAYLLLRAEEVGGETLLSLADQLLEKSTTEFDTYSWLVTLLVCVRDAGVSLRSVSTRVGNSAEEVRYHERATSLIGDVREYLAEALDPK